MLTRTLLLLLLVAPMYAAAQPIANMHREILQLAQHSPTATAILSRVDYDFERYVHGNNWEALLKGFGTVVHESAHHHNNNVTSKHWQQQEDKTKSEHYIINDSIEVLLEFEKVFNSRKLNKIVPDSLQKQIFRYPDYVGNRQVPLPLASQAHGIYGLMEEWSAYHLDARTHYELFDYYRQHQCDGYNNAEAWAKYMSTFAGNLVPYYEFKLFMSWYLQYAKQEYPEVYQRLMQHHKLRLVYTLIDNQYGEVVQHYKAMLPRLVSDLNAAGNAVEIAKGFSKKEWMFYVSTSKRSRKGYGLFEGELQMLIDLLHRKEHAVLNAFRLEGATIDNYEEYLE